MRTNTRKLDDEIAALIKMRDEEIDTSDIPEVKDWSKAVIGKFYRPRKEPITIRLDAEVVAQLKAGGPGYQTRINALLRSLMSPDRAEAGLIERNREPTGHAVSAVAHPQFRFRCLEERRELDKSRHIADVIRERGSVFALAG